MFILFLFIFPAMNPSYLNEIDTEKVLDQLLSMLSSFCDPAQLHSRFRIQFYLFPSHNINYMIKKL